MNYSKMMTVFLVMTLSVSVLADLAYTIVDTGQERCYGNKAEIKYPEDGQDFYGQDAMYQSNLPKYKSNGDGTVSDLNTGLMWIKDPGEKKTYTQAVEGAGKCKVAGYTNWRLPTIKELYSLIIFSGQDPDVMSGNTSGLKPFIDTEYFKFSYGNPKRAERIIDSQFATSTKYVHKTMRGADTMFGVNFADGRIKGYGLKDPRGRGEKKFYVLYVRGNEEYGKNKFVDNKDGTITDKATGLTWMKSDSQKGMNWQEALDYAENLELAGKSNWRLPNAKELQSIVDYTRSPATTNSAAIDPVFDVSSIKVNKTIDDYPYYWTSTTHKRSGEGRAAVYISFGKGYGWMTFRRSGEKQLLDVHGAGSQRSDPKAGVASKYPQGRGPQGDVLRINNYIRCVRGGDVSVKIKGPKVIVVKERAGRQSDRMPDDMLGGQGQGGGMGSMGQRSTRGNFIKRLDTNSDGRVSRDEFDGPDRAFNRFDSDGDGYISQNEVQDGPPQRRNGQGRQRRQGRQR